MIKRVIQLVKIARKLSSSGALDTIDQIYRMPLLLKVFFDIIALGSAKKILAYEVTKIVRGEDAAKQALDISNNLFKSKITDLRINNYSVELKNIKNSSFTIIDAIEKLELVKKI